MTEVREESALGGLRVIELGGHPAGAFCGRMLALAGADVVKVHPGREGIDPLSEALDRGKRRLRLDFGHEPDRLWNQLVEADAVVETLDQEAAGRRTISYERLAAARPSLVLTSISPFGRDGPYKHYEADDLVVSALGGLAYGAGDPCREPLGSTGLQISFLTGVFGYLATVAALRGSRRSGIGDHVDVSMQATAASLLEGAVTAAAYSGWTWRRSGRRRAVAYHPVSNYPCADGYVNVTILEEREWKALCELLGLSEVAEDARFSTSGGRLRHADEVDAILEDALRGWRKAGFYQAAQSRRLACGPVNSLEDVLELSQLRARRFLGPTSPESSPLPRLPWLSDHRRLEESPHFDEHASCSRARGPDRRASSSTLSNRAHGRARPLWGLRVLDCTHSWAGPLATRILAHLGAEVIHVEAPKRPDRWRGPISVPADSAIAYRYPQAQPGDRCFDRNALFNEQNRGKFSLVLDLATDRGRDTFSRLAELSDIVVTNFSRRGSAKLKLNAASLHALRDDLISVSITGLGEGGPHSDHLAWGVTIEAMSGASSLKGYPDGPPLLSNMAFGDPVGGVFAAAATLTAVALRDATGRGCHVDLSLLEATTTISLDAFAALGLGKHPERNGNRHLTYAPRGCYRCAGRDCWIAITIRSDEEWQSLVEVMGNPSWADRPELASAPGRIRHHDELDVRLAQWTIPQDRHTLMRTLQRARIAAGCVLTNVELLADPQLLSRGYFERVVHPAVGSHAYPGMPFRFANTPSRVTEAAPMFGQHNDYTLREVAGLLQEEVDELIRTGVTAYDALGPSGRNVVGAPSSDDDSRPEG
jgi:crotonobetainyl-CoA:carnitine CoA-transferase CaiB-like acyl-CoA transferase